MKKIFTFFCCFTFIANFSNVFGNEGLYFGGQFGIALLQDSDISFSDPFLAPVDADLEFDPGFAIGGVLGYDHGSFRLEGELVYRTNDVDKVVFPGFGSTSISGDASSSALLCNGYYDIETNTAFIPYLGGGIGFANVDFEDDDDNVFAYQLGVGFGYAVTDGVTIDFGYRYFSTADPEFDGGIEAEYSSHNFLVGVRIQQ